MAFSINSICEQWIRSSESNFWSTFDTPCPYWIADSIIHAIQILCQWSVSVCIWSIIDKRQWINQIGVLVLHCCRFNISWYDQIHRNIQSNHISALRILLPIQTGQSIALQAQAILLSRVKRTNENTVDVYYKWYTVLARSAWYCIDAWHLPGSQ